MIVTKRYLLQHRTDKGAWTRAQIEALGISWPPAKGWQDEVIGNVLTEEKRVEFEAKRPAKQKNILSLVHSLRVKIQEIPDKQLSKLFKVVDEEYKRRIAR